MFALRCLPDGIRRDSRRRQIVLKLSKRQKYFYDSTQFTQLRIVCPLNSLLVCRTDNGYSSHVPFPDGLSADGHRKIKHFCWDFFDESEVRFQRSWVINYWH